MKWLRTNRPKRSGMTLLEVAIAMVVSTTVLAALFVFSIPWVKVFTALVSNADYRTSLVGTMDQIEKEASSMSSIYVDSTKCYAVCMVDTANLNRIYYYFEQGSTATYRSLYRKTEALTNPVTCSGGKTFARNLKYASTQFTQLARPGLATNALLTVKLVGKGDAANTNPFPVYNVIFPSVKERKSLFTEGFECNTLANGWSTINGASSSWTVGTSSTGMGKYVAIDSQGATTGSNTSTLSVLVDLSRVSTASLGFSYFNDGTIGTPDSFTTAISTNGGTTWTTLFSDTTGQAVLAPAAMSLDISAYAQKQTVNIRFQGSLRNSGSHWYIDGIQIYNP